MNLKKMERYLRVNPLGPGPRLMKKEFTGPWSHKVWETLLYTVWTLRSCGNHGNIPLSFSPQSLYRQSYPGLRNTQCKMKSHPYHGTHTHTHTHVPYLVWRKSYDADEECYCFTEMFPFCKSACKQFRVVTMNYLMSREGGFNKGNLRED